MSLTLQELQSEFIELTIATFINTEVNTLLQGFVQGGTITQSEYNVLSAHNLEYFQSYQAAIVSQVEGALPYQPITYGDPVCFVRGTRILTERGEVAVESLVAGDRVVTVGGEGDALKAVRWIGHRRIDCRRYGQPKAVQPICIRQGAFGENLPRRDLLVSPAHALYIEGLLIPTSSLVNGATVSQDQSADHVDYFHVELDGHDVLVAEGLPAESYIECGNRSFFDNFGGPVNLRALPDATATERQYCARVVSEGPEVAAIRSRLVRRAREMGFRLTQDVSPCLVVDGSAIQPTSVDGTVLRFDLPDTATNVQLVSKAARPIDVYAKTDDWRTVGIAVSALCEIKDGVRYPIALRDPRLIEGWHGIEGRGATPFRWTDGAARLPAGLRSLEITVHHTATVWSPSLMIEEEGRHAA